MILARTIILIIILPLIFMGHGPLIVQAIPQVPVTLGVLGEGYSAADIIDPSLVVGTEFNVTVEIEGIPPILDATQGGLQGFDISVSYNSTMLGVVNSGFRSPYCSTAVGCLYSNLYENQILTLNNTVDSENGIARLAIIAANPGLRATGSGALFKISFKILALGFSTISIIQNVSQLFGFSNHCAQLLSYTATNATADNRRPYHLVANPPSLAFLPGQSKSANVSVYRVNSAGDGDVTLLISGIAITQITYSFNPRTSTLDGSHGISSFNSNLTISSSPDTPVATYHLEIIAQLSSTLNQFDQARLNFTLFVGTQPAAALPISLPTQPPQSLQPANSNTLTVTSYPDPVLPLLARFNIIAPIIAGSPATLTPTICGGTAPYQASWNFGDGNATTTHQDQEGVGSSNSHNYAAPGLYQVSLKIADAQGRTFTTSQTIAVATIPQSSPLVGAIEVGTVLIITLIVAAAYLRRHRRTRT